VINLKMKIHTHNSLARRLRALSMNMWWTWNPDAQALFNELSPHIWRHANHNAVEVLKDISEIELEARLRDKEFSRRVYHVLEEFDSYMAEPSTWAKHHASEVKNPIAYFSAEFEIGRAHV
jgi:glycogen phosphorylase